MPTAVIASVAAAAIGGGAAIIGANKQSDATQSASEASQAANAAALAQQQQQYEQTRADYAPWRAVGAGALQMLARTEGVQVPVNTFSTNVAPVPNWDTSGTTGAGTATGSTTSTPAAPAAPVVVTPGVSSEDAYLAANPDVATEYQQESTRDNKSKNYLASLGITTPEQFADWHYATYGKNEGRTMPAGTDPVYAPTPAPAATTTTSGSTTPAPVATNTNGDPVDSNGIASGLTAGSNSRYGDFYASPDYQFRLDEGTRAITGNKAAAGLLDSGALGKGLINYGQGAASQEFGNWYNRIAALAGVGQTATAGTAAAGTNAANESSNIIANNASTLASSIAAQGGITAGLINSVGSTTAGLINNLGKSSSGGTTPLGSTAIPTATAVPVQTNYPGLIPTGSDALHGSVV